MAGTSPAMTTGVVGAACLNARSRLARRSAHATKAAKDHPPAKTALKPVLLIAAILFAFAPATFPGAGVVTAQLGLLTVEPLSGAAISVPSFSLLFLLLSPLILQGEPV